ncbi:peptidylprolyl isomerase [Bartonella ancashensis]|uniref:Survival protein SurA (Peptidyl-prolyl cis-trans isomerase SurA) n=1 Tax=Bartonella ancashensis TaxID=1318743 RepID=A0A0M4LJG4_9HYPH|nr:peptidylprolyl isomerase [Bartonella ancashensis]ALE03968.1 Survival protein SurA precursor (Peptidyl-prolyl cis-trans isomerase SurA) [Bartonella ancashensis]
MNRFKNTALALFCLAFLSASGSYLNQLFVSQVVAQTSIAVTVNGNAITSYDIQKRVAFLKLQQREGNLAMQAREELIDEILKSTEVKNRGIDVSKEEVDDAFESFAEQNNMTLDYLSKILTQMDITVEHFKGFIRNQIGWGRLVNARYQAEGNLLTEQEVAHRILKNGGVKPSTNEYTLQQIIFVIPSHRRAELLKKRTQEANNFRTHFRGCEHSKKQAEGVVDVTIRSLGRFLEPQLPKNWEKDVRSTAVGKITNLQETSYGVEMLAVCKIKKVSDDRVAQLLFSIQDNEKSAPQKLEALSKKYLNELRQAAHIENSQ